MNPCGACEACCMVFAIPELNKVAYANCPHLHPPSILGPHGCTIHENAPPTCKKFDCLWKMAPELKEVKGLKLTRRMWEQLGDFQGYRPDVSGLILTMPKPELQTIVAWEVWPCAADRYWGDKLIKLVSRRYKVVVRGYRNRSTTLVQLGGKRV